MRSQYALKFALGIGTGMAFWFLALLVFMVYAFMPPAKLLNQNIFTVIFPLLYLGFMVYLFRRLFGDRGWKNVSLNLLITVLSAAAALLLLDAGQRFAELIF